MAGICGSSSSEEAEEVDDGPQPHQLPEQCPPLEHQRFNQLLQPEPEQPPQQRSEPPPASQVVPLLRLPPQPPTTEQAAPRVACRRPLQRESGQSRQRARLPSPVPVHSTAPASLVPASTDTAKRRRVRVRAHAVGRKGAPHVFRPCWIRRAPVSKKSSTDVPWIVVIFWGQRRAGQAGMGYGWWVGGERGGCGKFEYPMFGLPGT